MRRRGEEDEVHERWTKNRETRREGEEERERAALGSRDLVWYPTPPWCALASTHILGTPPLAAAAQVAEGLQRGERMGA